MKARLSLVTLFFLTLPGQAFAQLSLDVVYPREEQILAALDTSFVFGSVSEPKARVFVNNHEMQVYENGAFLGLIPVRAGQMILTCHAVFDSDSVAVTRQVIIPAYLQSTPVDTFAIDSAYVYPAEDMEVEPGELVQFVFKGTPGMIGRCTVPGLVESLPMTEKAYHENFYWGEAVFGDGRPSVTPNVAGIYTGVFRIPHGVTLDSARVYFDFGGVDGLHLQLTAPGRLTVRNDSIPRVAVLVEGPSVARTGPGLGYQQFLPEGVKLVVTGKRGRYYRCRLTESEELWLPEDKLEFLPPGTAIPTSHVTLVRATSLPDKAQVRVYLQDRLPFKIEQHLQPSSLVLSIYGATSDTDWIRYDFEDPTIRHIKWQQPQSGAYQLEIELEHGQQWGYNPFYEGNVFVLEIKRPPPRYKLDGLLICIDPGHAPADGAVGPTRLTEKDANLALSLVLKKELEDKGATVFLTRYGDFGAGLAVRSKMAAFVEADLLLSIHHNALPDGVNPFRHRGTSTYYYHPQSQALAASIQRRLLEKLRLNDFGLYYDNLAMVRPPQMPCVLIESAFIMHPQEEILIDSEEYKKKAADAIIKGIEDFLRSAREEG